MDDIQRRIHSNKCTESERASQDADHSRQTSDARAENHDEDDSESRKSHYPEVSGGATSIDKD